MTTQTSASPLHNAPGLPELSPDEQASVEAGRTAVVALKKSFENWLTIARALKALRDKADDAGGKFTFDRLRERENLGKALLAKGRVSRLLSILASHDAVVEWRHELTDKQQFEWASPEAVHRHCPVFAKDKVAPKEPPKQRRVVPVAKLEKVQRRVEELQGEVERLEVEKGELDKDNAVLHRRLDEAPETAGTDTDDTALALDLLGEALDILDRHFLSTDTGSKASKKKRRAEAKEAFSPGLFTSWVARQKWKALQAEPEPVAEPEPEAIEVAIAGDEDDEPGETPEERDERLARGKRWHQAAQEAWIKDHPGHTAADFNHWSSCAATDEQVEHWEDWHAKFEPQWLKGEAARPDAPQYVKDAAASYVEPAPKKPKGKKPKSKKTKADPVELAPEPEVEPKSAEPAEPEPAAKADGWSWQDAKITGPDGKEYWTATSVVGSRGEVAVEPDFSFGGKGTGWLVMFMPNRMHPDARKRLNRRASAKTFEKGKAWAERHFTKHL